MLKENSVSTHINLIDRLEVKQTVLVLGLSVLLPFLVHFIPVAEKPAGAVLLPLFIAPFIALCFFKWHVAVITALLSPLLNYAVTGMPRFESAGILTAELLVFAGLGLLFSRISFVKLIAAPLSIVASVFAVQLFLPDQRIFSDVIITGIPGIIILSAINIIVVTSRKKIKNG